METEKYTTQQPSIGTQSGQLLSAEQRAFCEQIAVGENLDSKRALALLIVDKGVTQEEAAQQAGLTLYQVKYCLVRFRKLGVSMFPDALLAATQPDPVPAPEPDPEPVLPTAAGEAEIISELLDEKPDDKAAKGKKRKKKNKKKGATRGKPSQANPPRKRARKRGPRKPGRTRVGRKTESQNPGRSSGNKTRKKNKR